MKTTTPIVSILLLALISGSCGVSKRLQMEATPESVNEDTINKTKVFLCVSGKPATTQQDTENKSRKVMNNKDNVI